MKLHRKCTCLALAFLLLIVAAGLSTPSTAQMAVGISVRIGPPALPVYEQPICPGPGFLWVPGYWAWSDDDGYYWVPGTWVEAPEPGFLWTPGYWGWVDGAYLWNAGYWGPEVGFYGGINYGFGYFGSGFGGGEWRGGRFFYNTAVMRVNTTTITNVYVNKTVIVNNTSHVAFNGGQGGVQARPTGREEAYMHEHHTPPVAAQTEQAHAASQNRAMFASSNRGRPAVAATAKAGEFSGRGVVAARAAGGTYHAPAMSPKEARAPAGGGNRAAESRPAENRPSENRAAKNAPKNEGKPAGHANTSRPTEPRNNAARPESRPSQSRASKPAPKSAPHASEPKTAHNESPHSASKPKSENAPRASAPKEAAPKERAPKPAPKASRPESRPTAAPKQESAPRNEPKAKPSEPRASSRPAPAPRPAPPAKHEAPPKNEHKGR